MIFKRKVNGYTEAKPNHKTSEDSKEKKEPKTEEKNEPKTEEKNNNLKLKSDYYGLGIIGNSDSEVLRAFKSKCKMKNVRVGKILYELISDWNAKN